MAYWILKTEPNDYSFADLEAEGTTVWDGVHNNAALKQMRAMQPGDQVAIYHTGNERQIVGLAEVITATYPDPAADPPPEGKPQTALVVDIRALRQLTEPVSLAAIKRDPFFADFALVRQSRLSVVPVDAEQWQRLMYMAGEE